jgi:hypothetical protein
MPVLAVAVSCFAMAMALVPFALWTFMDDTSLKWVPAVAVLASVTSSSCPLLMLFSAYCTLVVFTDLHRSIPWTPAALQTPNAIHRWWAGPDYLTELPLEDEELEEDQEGDREATSAHAHLAS